MNTNQLLGYKKVIDNSDIIIWSYDVERKSLMVSERVADLYDVSYEDLIASPESWKQIVHPADLYIAYLLEEKVSLKKKSTWKLRVRGKDKRIKWIKVQITTILNDESRVSRIDGIILEVTDYVNIKNSLKECENCYNNIFEISKQFIFIHDEKNIICANPYAIEALGIENPKVYAGESIYSFIHPNYHNMISYRIKKVLSGQKVPVQYMKLIGIDKKILEVEIASSTINHQGKTVIMTICRDITESRKAEENIKYLSYFDVLTGLRNKYHLNDYINRSIIRCSSNKEMLGVMFINLDRFKMINEALGHNYGDLLLQKVAKRLQKHLRKKDAIFHYSGDEFIVVIENINKFEIEAIAKRLITNFSASFNLNGQEVFAIPTIGVSMFPEDGDDSELLIKNADAAMHLAKKTGKSYTFYTNKLDGVNYRRMYLENGLRKALEEEELKLFYQPQIDLKTNELIGVEALLRWNHPKYGIIGPGEFIPLAEEIGLIIPIGEWVLRKACMQNKRWQLQGLKPFTVAVNISVIHLVIDNFVDNIKEVLNDTELLPKHLELEITESIMHDLEKSNHMLTKIKELGVQVSIDDFGTGYSSLSVLNNLPIDELKIDKYFVQDNLDNERTKALLKVIIDLGQSFNFRIVAEGIETEEQLNFLKTNNCDIGQGYYYSKPLPEEEITKYIKNYKA